MMIIVKYLELLHRSSACVRTYSNNKQLVYVNHLLYSKIPLGCDRMNSVAFKLTQGSATPFFATADSIDFMCHAAVLS